MIPKLLSAAVGVALVLTSAPVLAAEPPPNLGSIAPLVSTCRTYVQIAYQTGDMGAFDAYVERLIANRKKRRDEIVACGAYIAGAMDMAEGRIVPARRVLTRK